MVPSASFFRTVLTPCILTLTATSPFIIRRHGTACDTLNSRGPVQGKINGLAIPPLCSGDWAGHEVSLHPFIEPLRAETAIGGCILPTETTWLNRNNNVPV